MNPPKLIDHKTVLSACALLIAATWFERPALAKGLPAVAVQLPTPEIAPGQASGDFPKPYLVALSVRNMDRSIAFYVTFFGFKIVERSAFPQLKMELAFLDGSNFRIELVQVSGAQPRLPPDAANDASLHGIVKLGFAVDDVDGLIEQMRASGAHVVVEAFDDPKRGFRTGIVHDPDGNAIGLYELGRVRLWPSHYQPPTPLAGRGSEEAGASR